jgi:hypothetical protein
MAHYNVAFLLGFIFAFVVLSFLLKSPRRLRKVARVLVAIANALEGKATSTTSAEPAAAETRAGADPLETDVVSALLNFEKGRPSKQRTAEVTEIVRGVIAQNRGAGFDDTFRAALKLMTRPAARVAA